MSNKSYWFWKWIILIGCLHQLLFKQCMLHCSLLQLEELERYNVTQREQVIEFDM